MSADPYEVPYLGVAFPWFPGLVPAADETFIPWVVLAAALLVIVPLFSPVLKLLRCFYTLLLNPTFMTFIAGLLLVMTMDVASPPF